MTHDVIIIGGGPAGLTAAIYAARRGLRTLVLTKDIGGQAAITTVIENYPGYDSIDGLGLMTKFKEQAEKSGATIQLDSVTGIARAGGSFKIAAGTETFESPSVIFANGLTHRKLGVPREEALTGRGVSYCATCDAPLYRNKPVAVIGGGNSGMDAALLLARQGSTVDLITDIANLIGEQVLIDKTMAEPKITVHYKCKVNRINGTDRVTGLVFDEGGENKDLELQGVFIEIGYIVDPTLVRGLVDLDQHDQIVVNSNDNSTSVPGLFAAGDVTTIAHKQVIISAGEGAKAALGVYQYLQSTGRIKSGGGSDWGTTTSQPS